MGNIATILSSNNHIKTINENFVKKYHPRVIFFSQTFLMQVYIYHI